MSSMPNLPRTFGATPCGAMPDTARAVLDGVGLDFLNAGGPAFIADGTGIVIWGNAPWHDFARRLEPPPPAGFQPWPIIELVAAAKASTGPVPRHDRLTLADGAELIQSRHWFIFDATGALSGWAGCIAEPGPTERLRQQMSAQQERLDDLARLVSDWVWEVGPDLALSFVSPRVNELLGILPREMLGRSIRDFGHFVDEEGRPLPCPLSPSPPRPFRNRIFLASHADGRPLQFRFAALPVFDPDSGAFLGFRGTARDVTAEAAALSLVAKSRSQLSHAIDSISEGFALFDTEERLVLSNQKYLDGFPGTGRWIRTGQTHVEIFARALEAGDIIASPSTEPLLQDRLAARAGAIDAIEWQTADGRWIRAADRLTSDGSIVGIHTDITEWKRRERALYDAKEAAEQANRTKSEFLANISHELRTPLNAIIGFSELIVSETMGPIGNAQYKDYLNDVLNSGRHLLDVINDIIELARAEAGRLELNEEAADLGEAVTSVLRIMRERAMRGRVQLSADLPDDLPPVQADPRKLRQILTNLVSNAIKFTHEDGIVTIAARIEGETGDLLLQVIDTGIGIAADDIPTAFKPFGQIDARLSRQYEGTGLGLPLTKVMVEMHQGRITIDSAVGIGTTVTVRLPASRVCNAAARERNTEY